MSTITIDGIEYNVENLSDEAKSQVVNLRFVQSQLELLNAKIAIYKTAEMSYATALKGELDKND